ncbi:hypothetical protein [Maricaulis maris]|uniref:hypothetical protein n=1 Tax=Maricaulis maris TaxID=74318 RepID=UPI003B8C7232
MKNYPEMLAKLSFFFFLSTAFCFFLMRYYIPPIAGAFDTLAAQFPENLKLWDLSLSDAIPLVIAMVLAWLAHGIRWHDRLSDWFRIRQRFDMYQIVIPTALLVGANVDSARYERIMASRDHLMRQIFYQFASSGDGDERIVSNHTLREALTTWSWYWVLLEAVSAFIPTAIILWLYGAYHAAFMLALGSIISIILMQYYYGETSRYAKSQVFDIVDDKQRSDQIRDRIEAL